MLVCGLDLGSRAIRVAVVKTGFGAPSVVHLDERPLGLGPDGSVPAEEIANATRELVAKLPAGVESFHTALPGDGVSARLVDIPAAAARKAEQVLAFELEALLPFDLATSVFHFQPAPGSPTGKARFLVAAAPATRVEAHLADCKAAGVDPRALSAGALPLADLVPAADKRKTGPAPEPPALLVVDVGHRRTDLVGVVGGKPVFARTVSHGGADVTQAIATAYEIPADRAESYKHAQATLRSSEGVAPEGAARLHEVVRNASEPLLRDLKQSIASLTATTGLAPVAIALTGGGSRLAGFAEILEATVRLPVSPLDPPALEAPIDAERFSVFGKALGLALRAASRAPRIDLRRGSFAVQADARALRGRMVASGLLLLLVAFAWGFSTVARYAVLGVEEDRQKEQLQKITKELLGEEIADFERAEALVKGTGGLRDPMPQMDAFAVLDTLSKRIPEEIQHDVDELEISAERAEVRGLVDSLADVDRVYEALSGEPCFPVVNRGKTTRNTSDGRQKYQLDVEIRCPAAEGEGAPGETSRPGEHARTEGGD